MKRLGWILLGLATVSCSHRETPPSPASEEAAVTGVPVHYLRAYPVALPVNRHHHFPVVPASSDAEVARVDSGGAPPSITAPTSPLTANAPSDAMTATNGPVASSPSPEAAPFVTTTAPSGAPSTETNPASPSLIVPPPTVGDTNAAGAVGPSSEPQSSPSPNAVSLPIPPGNSTATDQVVVLQTTYGRMVMELDDFAAPKTCANFRQLVGSGFYNGTIFHRVIPQFIIQGGDPNTKLENRNLYGEGDPGYTLPAEIKLDHDRGAVAMARLSDSLNPQRYSNGSQFYICVAPCPSLDGKYTVFGHIIQGMDVAEKIALVPRDRRDDPLERISMDAHLEPRVQALHSTAAPADQNR